MLGDRRAHRRRRARADDGAPARAARAARLVPRDRAQRPAVPRLVDLRADHHRDRRVRARRPGVRLRRALVLEAPVRRIATALALLGPIGFVRRFVRKFAIWAVAASIVYLAWWIPAHGHLHRLWNGAGQGGSFFAGDGSRDRADRLVDPARRRLHALLDHRRARLLGRRARLPVPDAVPVRLRRDPRPLAPVDLRAGRRAHDDRGGRRRELPRAARADRRRDRRGVREHLLGRGVDAELRAGRPATRADRRLLGGGDRRRARRST